MRALAARDLWLRLHRWLGLTAGVIFAVAAGTGAILVYADELDVLLGGPRYHSTSGLIGPETIEAVVRQQAPGRPLIRVLWPAAGAHVITVRVGGGGTTRDLVLDAGSGSVMQPRPPHAALAAIRRLHVSLFAGSVGSRVVWLATCATLVSLLAGMVLWWPGLRRLPQALRVRVDRGLLALDLDLHQTLGILALPLLLVMSLTGILMDPGAMALATKLLHGAGHAEAWETLRPAPSADAATVRPLELSRVVGSVQAAFPGARLAQVTYPAHPDGVIQVMMRPAGAARPSVRLALDQDTGAVLLRQNLIYDAAANGRLHFGLTGGPVVRAAYAIACAVGFGLLPSGVLLWWMKRRTRTP